MDKEKFLRWLSSAIERLETETPEHLIEDDASKLYLKGGIDCLTEVRTQIIDGKFDA